MNLNRRAHSYKLATIGDYIRSAPSREAFLEEIPAAIKRAAKRGVHFADSGRAYVPESQRGRGVGYNGKRAKNRSDGAA